MKKLSFIELAEKILDEERKPLNGCEIWDIAKAKGYENLVSSQGQTPWVTMGARLYVNVKNSNSIFQKVPTKPAKFTLKRLCLDINVDELTEEQIKKEMTNSKKDHFKEKDLHPIMAYYGKYYLNVYTKTINHLTSKKDKFAIWMHPDMVGCYFPFEYWEKETSSLSSIMGCLPIKLFSFELKQELNFSNLREYFFQTVSNSSWANESYIVTASIESDEQFKDELKRLSSSYGVGVILLDINDPDASQILYQAKERDNLDWDTINKIAELNKDFKTFISRITNDIKTQEIREEEFDEVKDREELILTK